MHFLRFLVFFFCLRLSLNVDKNVVQLNDQNFNKQLKLNENFLVLFYVPWSGLCQKLRPHYAQAANILKHNELAVALGKMDCSAAGVRTCSVQNLRSNFPAVHFYHKGEFVKEYTGSRETRSIVKFMRVTVLPSPIELKDIQEFKTFLKKQDDIVVVGFFDEDSNLKRVYFRIADEMKELVIFAYSSNERLLRREGVLNGIVLYRPESLQNNYEEEKVLFTGRDIIGEIKNFLAANYHGLLGHRTPKNKYEFTNPLIVIYYTVDHHSDGRELNYWKIRLIRIAHKYKKYVKMALSAKDDFEDELYGLDVDYLHPMKPYVLGHDLENYEYIMDEEFTTDNFDKYVNDFVEGKIAPLAKSKFISQDEKDGAVYIAVTDNFEELVIKNDQDVLIDMYRPWSGRYRKFAPILRRVADLLLDEEIVVARMDTTINDLPSMFRDKAIPNVYWLRRGKKYQPVLYQGNRTVDAVIQFVASQASKELKHYDRRGRPRIQDEL